MAQAAVETAANKQIEGDCRGYAVGSTSSVNNPLLNTKGLPRAGVQYLIKIPTVPSIVNTRTQKTVQSVFLITGTQ